MKYLLSAFDTGTYILFTILMIVAILLISVFMFFKIRQERKQFSSRISDKGVMSLDDFKRSVDRTLAAATQRAKFHFFQIDIRFFDELKKMKN